MSYPWQKSVEDCLSHHLDESIAITEATTVGGGCIHESFQLSLANGDSYFLKLNRKRAYENFLAEYDGLTAIAATRTIRVPTPIVHGCSEESAFLVLEWLDFDGSASRSGEALGRQLAQLHRQSSDSFGWHQNNFIGSTPQFNDRHTDWISFWRDQRLRPQGEWAIKRGWHCSKWNTLLNSLEQFFDDYDPQPSLLHGDLWGGNASSLRDGTPVLFDPAVYFGDRETDIAFTHFFGGFNKEFYQAYNNEWPLHEGFQKRQSLYNLYHALNHFNLFGGSYGSSASQLVSALI